MADLGTDRDAPSSLKSPEKQKSSERRSSRLEAATARKPENLGHIYGEENFYLNKIKVPEEYKHAGGTNCQAQLEFNGCMLKFGSEKADFGNINIVDLRQTMVLHNGVTPPDYNIPIFMKAAEEINTYLTENKVAAVHCAHGSSRTSFSIVAYLVQYQRMDFDQAVAYVTQAQHRRTENKERSQNGIFKFNPEPTTGLSANKSYITQLREHFSSNENAKPDTSKVLTQTRSTPRGIVRSIAGTAAQQSRSSMDVDEISEVNSVVESTEDTSRRSVKRTYTSANQLAAIEAREFTGGKSSKTHPMKLRNSSRK